MQTKLLCWDDEDFIVENDETARYHHKIPSVLSIFDPFNSQMHSKTEITKLGRNAVNTVRSWSLVSLLDDLDGYCCRINTSQGVMGRLHKLWMKGKTVNETRNYAVQHPTLSLYYCITVAPGVWNRVSLSKNWSSSHRKQLKRGIDSLAVLESEQKSSTKRKRVD
jgi:hypothetical protein